MPPYRILLSSLLSTLVAGASHAAATETCTSESSTFDSRTITCVIEGTDTSQRYRLQANFTGGHDDTKASLVASLDGSPFACAPGSKTSLFGEDGEVSLWCDVASLPAGRQSALQVTVTWGHAQYADFSFRRP